MLLKEGAEHIRVSPDSLRELAESGEVPAAKIGPNGGRVWVFTDESLDEFVRQEIARQTADRRRSITLVPRSQAGPERTASGKRKPAPPPKLSCALSPQR